ncbi:hypothetical protein FDUTEX481_00494 [Tolypothrix sp. PCC 7601]|nr:hypothetical protein FDUTEX481_00494 [Tolypothrix sp. PCC 7601]
MGDEGGGTRRNYYSPIPITPYPQRGPRVPQSPVPSPQSPIPNPQSPLPLIPRGGPEFPNPYLY